MVSLLFLDNVISLNKSWFFNFIYTFQLSIFFLFRWKHQSSKSWQFSCEIKTRRLQSFQQDFNLNLFSEWPLPVYLSELKTSTNRSSPRLWPLSSKSKLIIFCKNRQIFVLFDNVFVKKLLINVPICNGSHVTACCHHSDLFGCL